MNPPIKRLNNPLSTMPLNNSLKLKLLLNYLNNVTLYQILLWLIIGFLTRGIIQLHLIVYAEGWLTLHSIVVDEKALNARCGIISEESDGNVTCEDAAYHQHTPSVSAKTDFDVSLYKLSDTSPLLEAETVLSNIAKKGTSSIPVPLKEQATHPVPTSTEIEPLGQGALSAEEIVCLERTTHLYKLINDAIKLINKENPSNSPSGEDVSYESMKQSAFIIMSQDSKLLEWIMYTEEDLDDVSHIGNYYLNLAKQIIDHSPEEARPAERRLLDHLATSMNLIQAASIENVDPGSLFKDDTEYNKVFEYYMTPVTISEKDLLDDLEKNHHLANTFLKENTLFNKDDKPNNK